MRGQRIREDEPLQDLPMELWREVFARLPAKTLLKFRCVCKSWYSIIDEPDFIPFHFALCNNNREKSNLLALQSIKLNGVYETRISIRPKNTFRVNTLLLKTTKSYAFHGNCNGLLLLVDVCPHSPIKIALANYQLRLLWNPSIRKSLVLPPCPLINHIISNSIVGFDPSNNEYKVVVFRYDFSKFFMSIAVYSLNGHTWRTKTMNVNFSKHVALKIQSRCSCYISSLGAAHWVVKDEDLINWCDWKYESHVVSFDFGTEEFGYVELPGDGDNMFRFSFILGKSLAVFGISLAASFIWVMRNDGGNDPWSLWFSVDSTYEAYNFFESCRSGGKVFYNEDSSTFLVLKHLQGERWSYNITTHQVEYLGKYDRIYHVDTYLDNLVLSKVSEGQTLISFP